MKNEDSTKNTYYKIWTKFNKFIIRLDRIPPTWEERTTLYCGYLIYEKGLQSKTVRTYISAIKSVLEDDGYSWNKNWALLSTLTRVCKRKYDRLKTRLPIQKRLLETILTEVGNKYSEQIYLKTLYQTAFFLAYYGLLRVGELTASQHTLKKENIHCAKNKNKLLLVLYTSKTHRSSDPPQKIRIEKNRILEVTTKEGKKLINYTSEKTQRTNCNTAHCPVHIMKKFIAMRQHLSNNKFLIFQDNTPMRAHHMRSVLRKCLTSLNLKASLYDTHSFRIGRATDLFKQHIPVETIKHLGRWKSNAVYKYLKD